jgi:hypothetical protein
VARKAEFRHLSRSREISDMSQSYNLNLLGAPAAATPVDVEAELSGMASEKGGAGNWHGSIR